MAYLFTNHYQPKFVDIYKLSWTYSPILVLKDIFCKIGSIHVVNLAFRVVSIFFLQKIGVLKANRKLLRNNNIPLK